MYRDEKRDEKDEALQKQQSYVTKIQAAVRGWQAKQQLQLSKQAATKIQAVVRGFKSRKNDKAKQRAASNHLYKKSLQEAGAKREAAKKAWTERVAKKIKEFWDKSPGIQNNHHRWMQHYRLPSDNP